MHSFEDGVERIGMVLLGDFHGELLGLGGGYPAITLESPTEFNGAQQTGHFLASSRLVRGKDGGPYRFGIILTASHLEGCERVAAL